MLTAGAELARGTACLYKGLIVFKKGLMTGWEFMGMQRGGREVRVAMTTSCAIRMFQHKAFFNISAKQPIPPNLWKQAVL